jgi:8-oxo-dGTP pyrophosphatase MutT (NUDIX family)
MSDRPPAPAVPAATILLLRDGAEGLEVFMVVRHHQIDFASGALVFPGGKADPADFEAELAPLLDGAADNPDTRAIQVAAIREAFEECGVLLARERGSNHLISGERLAVLDTLRDALHRGDLSIREFLEQYGLRLACDQLVHFAHWVTPAMMPKRFDTHFFLATAPADHLAVHDGHESVDSLWIRPADAIAEGAAGSKTIIFPTLRNIEKLGRHNNVRDALEAHRHTTPVRVLPWTEKRDDGTYLCIPAEADYDVSEAKMPAREAG